MKARATDPSGSVVSTSSGGVATRGPEGEQHEQRLVLDVVLERRCRQVVARAAQERRPVPAVQQVGVAAVTPVHLHERASAINEGGDVQL